MPSSWRSAARLVALAIGAAAALLGLAAATVWFLPASTKNALLVDSVKVARRVLRPALFRLAYQEFFRELDLLAEEGQGRGFDGADQSGEAIAIRHHYRAWFEGRPALVLFDVGAADGGYSGALLDAFGDRPDVTIHAFEPAAPAFQALRTRFMGDPRLRPTQVAIGDQPGRMSLFLDPQSPLMNTLVTSAGSTTSVDVDVTTLDAYCDAHGIRAIDLLKLDIEGYEMNALRGAERLLARGGISVIQFEYGSFSLANDVTFVELVGRLGPGFDLYRIIGDGLEPVDRSRLAAHNVLGGNYVARAVERR